MSKKECYFEKISLNQWRNDCIDIDNVTIIDQYYDAIKIPKQKTIGSAGMDFFAPYNIIIKANSSVIIPTGIRWVCSGDLWRDAVLLIMPRSGLGFKYGIYLANTIGIIDSDYYKSDNEGHILLKLHNPSDIDVTIKQGDGFAQGILTDFFICEGSEADKEDKRNGGFGSTDK